jgi:hypothetical protein
MGLVVNHQRLLSEWPSCYVCDAPKTSHEHVPPLCFFPDEKDTRGHSLYRKNLITVPSCDDHNTQKSEGDLYAAFRKVSDFASKSFRQPQFTFEKHWQRVRESNRVIALRVDRSLTRCTRAGSLSCLAGEPTLELTLTKVFEPRLSNPIKPRYRNQRFPVELAFGRNPSSYWRLA